LKKESEIDSKRMKKLQAELEKIKNVIKEGAKDTSMAIGTLWLKNSSVLEYYINTNIITDTVKIKEVIVQIKNGAINDIQVFGYNNQSYTNRSAGIRISELTETSNRLFTLKGNKKYYIYCQDIFGMKRKAHYLPSDALLEFKEINKEKVLTKKVGINSFIDARIYSDLLGLLGKESNGLAQTELNFNFPLHRKNKANSFAYFFSDLSAHVQFSRFDEKYQSTNLNPIDSNLSRSTLNQRSWMHTEFGLSAWSHTLQKKNSSRVYYNIVGGFSLSKYR
jgi:hypothetical protein